MSDRNDAKYLEIGGKGGEDSGEIKLSGKVVYFRSGDVVDSIAVVDGGTYGGNGGKKSIEFANINTNLVLRRVQCRPFHGPLVINYLSFAVNGHDLRLGTAETKGVVEFDFGSGLQVEICSVRSGWYIDGITFRAKALKGYPPDEPRNVQKLDRSVY